MGFIKIRPHKLRELDNTLAQKINWLDLTDHQRTKVLEQARTSLHEQIEEAKRTKLVLVILEKHGILY